MKNTSVSLFRQVLNLIPKREFEEIVMSAPSKAGICKLDNPARVKVSRRPGTELRA